MERSLATGTTESPQEECFNGNKGGFRALPFIFCEFRPPSYYEFSLDLMPKEFSTTSLPFDF